MDLKKIAEILGPIEVTDERVSAINKFFEDFATEIRTDERKKIKQPSGEKMIPESQVKEMFEAFEKDAEKAFEAFERDTEKAFAMFEEDAQKALDLAEADMKKEYTENFALALRDIYEEMHERVVADFMESKDFRALDSIKKAIAPIIAADNEQYLVEEIDRLKKEKEQISEEKEQINRETTISKLIKDLPEQYVETVREFISEGKTEDEVYERFTSICEIIEKTTSKQPITESKTPEPKKEPKKDDDKNKKNDKGKAKECVNEETKPSVSNISKDPKLKKKEGPLGLDITMFSEEDQNLLEIINSVATLG